MEQTAFYSLQSVPQRLFGTHTGLLPSVNELFELEMAYLEYVMLTNQELIQRGAFFKTVNNEPTRHFLLYAHQPQELSCHRSAQTRSYFESGQFATGYATHALFPYRWKFHPQLIKGLLNIIGIQPGETVLDPMCGSGTANIEAALMGINSFAVDVSPFCQFMTTTKYQALTIQPELLEKLYGKTDTLFEFFHVDNVFHKLEKINDPEKLKVYHLALLAYLDAMGYSKRVTSSTHKELFEKVLDRYIRTVKNCIEHAYFHQKELGEVTILPSSDALSIQLQDNSIDSVITSPPYSFAINYVKNDTAQLNYLGYDVPQLQAKMIGLIGKNKQERLQNYFRDMANVCEADPNFLC